MRDDDIRSEVLPVLGRQLRAAREAAEISQERLALDAGVDRTMVSLIERGQGNVSAVVLVKLARVIGTTPAALFEGIE